jgi:hypothetical protein|tara:strand:+ start:1625 stop:2326 length:702 start_codon:yes stop_codon:yes gene_type:complete
VILKSTYQLFYSCLFLFFGLGFTLPLFAQEEIQENSFYREDQFYIGVSFVALVSDQLAFNPRGISRHFQWGLIRDIPLSEDGQFAAGIGLGMSFERYNTNVVRKENFNSNLSYSISTDPNYPPFFFSIQSLELPLSIRWRNSSTTDYSFWRIYGGIALQWNYRLKAKTENLSFSVAEDLKNLGATAHLSFGYNTWNFYLAYKLTPFFNPKSFSDPALTFDISPIKIGLIFYLL